MENKEFWNVGNVGLVAYLLTDGFKYEEIKVSEYNGRSRVDFVFNNNNELHLAIKDFKENEFLQKYYNNIQFVRDKVYKAKKGVANE